MDLMYSDFATATIYENLYNVIRRTSICDYELLLRVDIYYGAIHKVRTLRTSAVHCRGYLLEPVRIKSTQAPTGSHGSGKK